MANTVTIRTSAPGAKQAAGEIKGVMDALTRLKQGNIASVLKSPIGLAATAGAALGTAGVAALRMGDDYQRSMEMIRTGSGKSGEALAGLEQSFKNVGGQTEHSLDLISQVMTGLHSRTDLTGGALEGLTQRVLDFSDVTRSDAVQNTADLTRLFGDWSIATEDQAETMDQLMRASQGSGIQMDRLMQTVVQFGAPMRSLGFSFEENIALLGKWEKEGVNIETIMTGMRQAVKNFVTQGIDPSVGMPALIEEIKGASDATGVMAAHGIVGGRAFNDFFRAVKEGRFDVDDLTDALVNGSDTVDQAAKDTEKFGDAVGKLKNKIKLAIGPIMQDFSGLADELGNAIYLLPAVGGAIGGVTAKLWLKVAALKASQGGWLNLAKSIGPATVALGAFTAGALIANEASKGMAAEADHARETIADFNITTREQAEALLEAARRMEESITSTKFMGVVDTDLTRSQLALAQQARDTANAFLEQASVLPTVGQEFGHLLRNIEDFSTQAGEAVSEGLGEGIGSGVGAALPEATSALLDFTKDVTDPAVRIAGERGEDVANAITDNFVDEVRDNKSFVKGVMEDLTFAITHPLKAAKEIARIEGALTSEKLANGLESGNPFIREAANQARDILIQKWEALTGRAYEEGEDAAKGYQQGLNDNKPRFPTPVFGGARRGGAGRSGPQRQHGGPVEEGEVYRVGEAGEEWFVPEKSGTILPNSVVNAARRARQMFRPPERPQMALAGAGGGVFNFNFNAPIYGGPAGLDQLASEMERRWRHLIRR